MIMWTLGILAAGIFALGAIAMHRMTCVSRAWPLLAIVPWLPLLPTDGGGAIAAQGVAALGGLIVLLLMVDRQVHVALPVKWLIAYGLLAIATAPMSIDPVLSALKAASFLGLVLLTAFLVGTTNDTRRRAALGVFGAFPAAVAAVALGGILLSPASSFRSVEGLFSQLTLVGLSTHPNTVGMILVLALLALGVRVASRRISRLHGVLLGTTLLLLLLLTRSRSALIMLVGGAMYVLWIRRNLTRRAIGVLVVAALLILVQGDSIGRFLMRSQTSDNIEQLSGRMPIWQISMEIWHASPFIGHGYYTAQRTLIQQTGRGRMYFGSEISTSDNVFLDVILGNGLLGLIPVALATAGALHLCLRARRIGTSRELSEIELLASVALIVALIRSVTASGFNSFGLAAVFLVTAVQVLDAEFAATHQDHLPERATIS